MFHESTPYYEKEKEKLQRPLLSVVNDELGSESESEQEYEPIAGAPRQTAKKTRARNLESNID